MDKQKPAIRTQYLILTINIVRMFYMCYQSDVITQGTAPDKQLEALAGARQ